MKELFEVPKFNGQNLTRARDYKIENLISWRKQNVSIKIKKYQFPQIIRPIKKRPSYFRNWCGKGTGELKIRKNIS